MCQDDPPGTVGELGVCVNAIVLLPNSWNTVKMRRLDEISIMPLPMLRISLLACIGLFQVVWLGADEPTQGFNLGVINRESQRKTIEVEITADSGWIVSLVSQAFSSHGGYELQRGGESDFEFRFSVLENNQVELIILSGRPAMVLFRKRVSGTDLTQTVLKAADLAVRKTSGNPGYFAGKLAWVGDQTGSPEVYVSDLFFVNVIRVTKDGAKCLSPNLAPDGQSVLFTSYYPNGFPDIYKTDLRSRQRELFMGFKGSNTGATYNPRGTEIALILSSVGNAELYICDLSGTHIRRLTHSRNAVEADPTWAPNGRTIAFTSDRLGSPQLFRVSITGGRPKRIPTNISGICAEPAWNPVHPNQIAFTILQGRRFKIALYDMAESRTKVITRGGGDAVEPTWLNDGRHIVYTAGKGKKRGLVLLDSQTGKSTELNPRGQGKIFQPHFVYPFP